MKKLILLLLAIFSISAHAAEYHVSTEGNDVTGDGSISNPWRTPEFGAKQLSQAGDILTIHAGKYILSQNNLPQDQRDMHRARALVSPPYELDGTPNNPIIIRSAGDGEVFLDAGVLPEWPAIGTNSGDYLTIDGFTIRGAVILWATKGSKLLNSNVFGGLDTPVYNGGDGFGVVVRLEECTDCLVRNNILHDNNQDTDPLITEYDSTNLIIEFNDIFNSAGRGIYLKDDPENVTIRYNFIHNNNISGIEGANQDNGHNVYIYNNIFWNNNKSNNSEYGAITSVVELDYWEIYNNTFYDNKVADLRLKYSTARNINTWNNIHAKSNSIMKVGYETAGARLAEVVSYSNFNIVPPTSVWQDRNSIYSSLTVFSSATGFDRDSIVESVSFINPSSGQAEGFKRLSYEENGRGGAYSPVIGAYTTGNEIIGSTLSYSSSHLPKHPGNVSIE